jgi:superfamily II DNA/RNA helicase
MIRSPADLGFDASAYALPPLVVKQVTVESDAVAPDGQLFAMEAQTLSERRQARRDSLSHRVAACAERVNASAKPWVIWCELNAEGDALRAAIPDAVEIRGSDTPEHKERSLVDFAAGRIRVLVTKPKIAGFGLNWQHCSNVAFIGVTDSFEAYYQAVRRCWRFGQRKPVAVYLFASDLEGAVRENLARKERAAIAMFDELSRETSAAVRDEIIGQARSTNIYTAGQLMRLPPWLKTIKREDQAA